MGIAHELITRGWTQGRAVNAAGEVCIFGAVLASAGVEPGQSTLASLEARRCAPEAVNALWRILGVSPMGWNDDLERTYDEVLRVAKEADELLGL